MKIDPLTPLAVIGASLTALGIVMVASSVEPPRIAPTAPTAIHTPSVAPSTSPPPTAPAPKPSKPARPHPPASR
jgi:hypothetical protein